MNDVDPKDRGVAMVFQNYALYPHKTVFDNMAMALKLQKVDAAEIRDRVGRTAEMLGLTDYLNRKPAALSGGQRQRVAIGRAIVRTPSVFLFDEPLSNLDAKLRVKMRMELQELHARLGATSVYVTHDQVEAMTMADKIVVLQAGYIEQVGSPLELYHSPRNEFVAGFIGSPKMNFIEGAEAKKFDAHTIGIRPEHLAVSKEGGIWSGTVKVSEHLGSDTFFHIDVAGIGTLTARAAGDVPFKHGETVTLAPQDGRIYKFDASGNAL
jgi:multiple sugar transport system ATP-binding protein